MSNTLAPPRATVARWAAGSIATALVLLLAVLIVGGGAPQPAVDGLPDAGPITGWGLPVVQLLTHLVGFGVVGLALVGSRVLHVAPATPDDALPAACRLAAAWAALAGLQAVLHASQLQAIPVEADPETLSRLLAGMAGSPQAQAALLQAALAVAVAWFGGLGRSTAAGTVALMAAVAAFVPPALAGHGGGALAAATMAVHVPAAALWMGGLAALAWAAVRGRTPLATALPRYSQLALGCVIMLAGTGVVNAVVRLGPPTDWLGSGYGVLLLGKLAGLGVLAGLGWLHRRHTVDGLRAWRRARRVPSAAWAFVALAAVELTVMAVTTALAVGLAHTPPPAPSGTDASSAVGLAWPRG